MAAFLASKASMAGLAAKPVTKSRAVSYRAARAAPARRGALQVTASKKEDGPVVAIAGVTGAVGQEFLEVSDALLPRSRDRYDRGKRPRVRGW